MTYTTEQIETAIAAEADDWAIFFRVDDEEAIEGRKQVMRANVAVGHFAPLMPYLSQHKKAEAMERFTAEDAFDASDCGEPIMVTRRWADKLLASHGADLAEFDQDHPAAAEYDAATVLTWLGY